MPEVYYQHFIGEYAPNPDLLEGFERAVQNRQHGLAFEYALALFRKIFEGGERPRLDELAPQPVEKEVVEIKEPVSPPRDSLAKSRKVRKVNVPGPDDEEIEDRSAAPLPEPDGGE